MPAVRTRMPACSATTRTPSTSSRHATHRLGRTSYLHYLLFGASGVLAMALAGAAHAGSVNWAGLPNGDWFTDSNWNWDGHTPTANDSAYITIAGPIITSSQPAQANTLFIGTGTGTDGTLLILSGSLQTQQTTLGNSEGAQGLLTVSGASGSWINTDNLVLGNGGQGNVYLVDGATATGGNTTLGASAGGSGTLHLQEGASFTSDSLSVGYAGNGGLPATAGGQGSVKIQSGASLFSAGATLADGIGASGTVTVDGTSSQWTNTGSIIIGGGGQGQLRITNGGKVINTGVLTVGHGFDSTDSSLSLNGTGSALRNNGALFVGNFGNATLTLSNRAALTTDSAVIGRHAVATATISDLQSQWTTGELLVGGDNSDPTSPFGSGTLTIQNKASVTSTSARLGDVAGATGKVNINGVGSTWTVGSGNLQIGASGTGTLHLQHGGLLNTQHAILGQNADANGTAYLSEQGSTWTAAGNIYVGNAGTGTLSITQGAKASSLAGYVGTQQGSNSSVSISGAGASWSMTESIIVGYESGAIGNVSLSNGGQLKAVQGSLGDLAGSRGTMFITGAGSNWHAFEDGQTAYAGYLNVGRHGVGELTITTGGSVTGTQLYVGNEASSSGTVRVFNDNSSIVMSERLAIGSFGNGALTLTDGALLRAADIRIAHAQGSTGTLNIGAASGQTAQAAGTVDTSSIVFGAGQGNLVLNHTNNDYVLAANINGAGKISVESGTTTLTGLNGYTGGTLIQGGMLSGQANSFGSGSIQNNAALVVNGGGTLANSISGTGSLEKTGSDTLTLAGNNTYTGGTVISSGTLVASTSSLQGNVVNNSTLILDQGLSLSDSLAGAISGTGNLVKDGISLLILTNANTYTGGTAVNAGTLAGLATSFGSGAIQNNAALLIHGGGTLANSISGTGSLLKIGSDTLTLTGNNTHTGGTVISSGTLVASTSNLPGNVFNKGTLTLNQNQDGIFAGAISDTGNLVKDGSSLLTLTNANTYTGGTLIQGGILSGQANSFGSGSIQNNAALVVNGGGTLANSISGTGSLEKTGSDTLTLAGNNTHTGGTVISSGTLVASTSSLQGNVANYGTLIIDQNQNGIFAGDISGSGNLVKDGSGIVTMAGNLSYSGSTTVRAGQLIGNTSSLSGSVINEGTLEFNQSFNGTYSSTISGSGSLTKAGTGTLTLTGANTYTGGTMVSAGALAGLVTSFGSGPILNNATLIINGEGTFTNTISGTGSLEKAGAGQLILVGTHQYTGPSTVAAGSLMINGIIASPVTVVSQATLGGNGTLGNLLVQSGAVLAPGNSIGTLTVNGDATLASGSAYHVEVDNTGNSDRLNATGAIHIGSGVTLNVRPENGTDTGANYALETRYTILNAANGVSGQFDTIDENFAYLTAAVDKSTDLKSLYLTLRRTNSNPGAFAAATRTPNASASAYAVEALGPANPLYQSVLYLQGDAPQLAFSQLAGELHAAVGTTLAERSRLSRHAILTRLNRSLAVQQDAGLLDPQTTTLPLNQNGAVTLWADAFGAWSNYKADGNGAAIRAEGGGLLLGADKLFGERWRLGLAAGYGRDHIKQTSLGASANADSYYLSAYGGAAFGAASVKFGAIHAFQKVKSKRGVAFSNFSDHLKADYDASTTQLFAEGAWRFDLAPFQIEPYANLAYVQTRTKGFSESGGAAALSADSQHHEQVFSTLGLRSGHSFTLGNTQGKLTAGIGWRHIFGTLKPETALSFAGGEAFNVASTGPARNALVLDLNAGFALSGNTDISVGYNAVLGKGIRDNAANARLKVRF